MLRVDKLGVLPGLDPSLLVSRIVAKIVLRAMAIVLPGSITLQVEDLSVPGTTAGQFSIIMGAVAWLLDGWILILKRWRSTERSSRNHTGEAGKGKDRLGE